MHIIYIYIYVIHVERERERCLQVQDSSSVSSLSFSGTASFTEKAAPMAATSALPAECNRGIGLGRQCR